MNPALWQYSNLPIVEDSISEEDKNMWEITFVTMMDNPEDKDGYWYNYYTADSQEQAVQMFIDELAKYRIRLVEIKDVKKIK